LCGAVSNVIDCCEKITPAWALPRQAKEQTRFEDTQNDDAALKML
jgi:hypothetical protein